VTDDSHLLPGLPVRVLTYEECPADRAFVFTGPIRVRVTPGGEVEVDHEDVLRYGAVIKLAPEAGR
jgi:hypothetical protein